MSDYTARLNGSDYKRTKDRWADLDKDDILRIRRPDVGLEDIFDDRRGHESFQELGIVVRCLFQLLARETVVAK